MKKHFLIKVFLAVSLITLVSIAVATPTITDTKTVGTQPAAIKVHGQAVSNGKIAFVSNRDGNDEIYTMNVDGTGQTRLTTNTASDVSPVWSPDGTRIAFATSRDGNYEIYTMNPDGSEQTRVTSNTASDSQLSWQPTSISPLSDFLSFTISLKSGWNLISVPLNLTTWELGDEAAVGKPLNVTPTNCLSSIYRFNSTSDLFEKSDHIADWGWWSCCRTCEIHRTRTGERLG
ncbi:MAG: PD40 domain-containing protein [Candidatus Methanoperedens sp.]|nr:PD40 domain-containing protein [Candidatus Methanoperedens sp.]MCE8427867.1 PD40 domain-containing protein [Candidatus Methanoperedens sp.]